MVEASVPKKNFRSNWCEIMLIQINGIRQVTSKAGKTYYKLETNKGEMSCFEEDVAKALYEAWRANTEIDVDAKSSEDNKYVNIRGLGMGDNKPIEQPKTVFEQPVTKPIMHKPSPQADYKPTSMYVSYAKDIFLGLLDVIARSGTAQPAEEMMNKAILLVKQAEKEFRES